MIIDTVTRIEKIKVNSEEEQKELERMRRWKVQISEIYLTLLDQEEIFDGFLQITIGGDFKQIVHDHLKKKKKIIEKNGNRGYTDYTEVIKEMKHSERTRFKKEIDIEIRESKVGIKKQNLVIELYDWNRWEFNELIGVHMFNFSNIIKGSVNQSCTIKKNSSTGIKDFCRIEFKCIFQEIWDFVMSFEDWSATNMDTLFHKDSLDKLNLGLEFNFQSKPLYKIKSTNDKKGTINPVYSLNDSDLKYRGTLFDLENEILEITVTNKEDIFTPQERVTCSTDLVGISEDGLIRQYLSKKKNDKKEDVHKTKINFKKQKEEVSSTITGKLNTNELPQYIQFGNESNIHEGNVYLCIYIGKLSWQMPNHLKNPKRVYLNIEWSDKMYKSKKIEITSKNILFDQNIYFMIDLMDKSVEDSTYEEREIALRDCITKNAEITVILMMEDDFNCNDYIGKFSVNLCKIIENGKPSIKKFKKDDNLEVEYNPKVYKEEGSFDSSFLNRDINLEYEMWFYPDVLLYKVEITQDSIRKNNTNNQILEKIADLLKNEIENIRDIIISIDSKYNEIRDRFFIFNPKDQEIDGDDLKNQCGFYVRDQDKNEHLINSFLGKLTIKDCKIDEIFSNTSIESMLKNRSEIENIQIPIDSPLSLLHYARCLRYHNTPFEKFMISPYLTMSCKKGSKFEIAIYLSCLMMNIYSNKYILEPYSIKDKMELKQIFENNNKINVKDSKAPSVISGKSNNVDINEKETSNSKLLPNNDNNNIDKEKSQISNSLDVSNNIIKYDNNQSQIDLFENITNITNVSQLGGKKMFKKREKSHQKTKEINNENELLNQLDKINNENLNEANNLINDNKHQSTKNENIGSNNPKKVENQKNEEKIKMENPETFMDKLKKKFDKSQQDIIQLKEKLNMMAKKNLMTDKTILDTSILVFVCMGTLKTPGFPKHMWIMTIDINFEDISFWEPTNKKMYKLKKRIEYPIILEKYFKNKYTKEQQILNDIKYMSKKGKGTIQIQTREQTKPKNNKFNKLIDENEDITKEFEQELPLEMLNQMDNTEKYINIQNKTSYAQNSHHELEGHLLKTFNIQQKNKKLDDQEQDRGNVKPSEFKWNDELGFDSKNNVLPYRTIDTIFNKQNIYINKQYPDPAGIYFDIYNTEKWYTVIKDKKDDEIIWQQDIPTFYCFRNFEPPYSSEEIDNQKKKILRSVEYKIRSLRSNKNFNTKFRKSRDILELVDLYALFLELKDTGFHRDKHYERIKNWVKVLKSRMGKERMTFLPIHFNYFNEDKIVRYLEENCRAYVENSLKNINLIVSCKIFQYPNRIISTRLTICTIYKISYEDLIEEADPLIFQTEPMNNYEVEKQIQEMVNLNKTNKTTFNKS